MTTKSIFSIGMLMGLSIAGMASAQGVPFGNPKPLSETGGYAAQQLRSIYRSAIGTNYNIDSLNRNTLNRGLARVPNVGQSTAQGSRLDTGLGALGPSAFGSKPFAGYTPAPTVSPYLNLFREDLDGQSDLNYQTLVRPQLQQQATNERLQREALELNSRLQAISAQADFNPGGSKTQPPTGHQTVFMYFGHYYPGMQQQRRR
jgi:hypothetical protein